MYNDRLLSEASADVNCPQNSDESQIEGHLTIFSWWTYSSRVGKRLLDISLATAALVLFAPLISLLLIAIYAESPGPVFYGHRRLGQDGNFFRCWKLRSMTADADQRLNRILQSDPSAAREWRTSQKLRSDPRVTKIGRLMRLTSIDEIPQLFNILVGHMSMVGPRPITIEEATRYGRHIEAYTSVKPGLTGLWQVCGRSETTYRRRVALDVVYTRRRNLMMDIWIIIMTVPAVFGRRGSY